MILALVQEASAAAPPSGGLIASVATGFGGLGVAAYWLIDKIRNNKIEAASSNLDTTALGAGSTMITALQADIVRLRETQSSNEAKWQSDMQRLQDRLDSIQKQADEAVAGRRAVEETNAKLRLQLVSNNLVPVA